MTKQENEQKKRYLSRSPVTASATQQTITTAFLTASKYKMDSKEQLVKEQTIVRWIGRTGLPLTTCENEDFIQMMETIEKKLTIPKKTKISNLVETEYEHERDKFKKRLAAARRVSIGLDMWTKKRTDCLIPCYNFF